ncbi:hypothetical protein HF086_003106 [Spodoptera exigua]|uniref:Uncharacterized protein n=1 Tax=Spodoptera exigua TaxID=7107 RepID=A0A922M3F4_SPOEX|nr:hypothetical protein HF086_003106 [Spodoptera exigua]
MFNNNNENILTNQRAVSVFYPHPILNNPQPAYAQHEFCTHYSVLSWQASANQCNCNCNEFYYKLRFSKNYLTIIMESVDMSKNSEKVQSEQPEPTTSTGSKASRPKRGRPSGANRTPLSLAEKRARNAAYERERRVEMALATEELIAATGVKPNISIPNLLLHTIQYLINEKTAEEYKRINASLEEQIANCFERLGPDYVLSGDEEEDSNKPDVGKNEELTEQLPPTSPLPQPGLPEPGSDHLLENQIRELLSRRLNENIQRVRLHG